mmetsp:Transcript_52187/g.82880  ORF Transcript_52187/g.82880 Transcript_52187/m.82880 type:complete len:210 (+) Transcript_52187:68-697(+)|eukprot:CAMPEP_0169106290 /NCGR_PEP_ID=MMETSP1015-20121227/24256_1 /TAXON_ID=342587 /ORGANISM="Karlodinium micrum, Strain CCMP2283" /LENGTH=209 /DNA_ID=CAMNT_0009167717 /DNA_START=61 /DNA_END=690 /DNA_ORIENTATION=+
MSFHGVVRWPLLLGAAIIASLVCSAEAAAQNHDRHAAENRLETLREKVRQAMLDLYMENAKVHLDDRLALIGNGAQQSVGTASPAPAPEMPFGRLEAFGREDTAQELTEASIEESDKMIDQIERAVVSETKRSMFRALTRLRGATISSYDGMANAQSANVANYAKSKSWTKKHKLKHLAKQEEDVEKWAFPKDAEEVTRMAPGPAPAGF